MYFLYRFGQYSGLFLVFRILDGKLLWISLTSIHEFLRHSSIFLITHRCCSNGDDSSNYFSCSYVIFYRSTKNQKKNSFVQKCFQILFNSKYCNSIHAVFQKYIRDGLAIEIFTFIKDCTGNKSKVSRCMYRYFWLRIHVYDITVDINKKRRDCRRIALNLADGWENEHLAFENILTAKQPNK